MLRSDGFWSIPSPRQEILVAAIMHLHRNPLSRQKRIEDESGDKSVQ